MSYVQSWPNKWSAIFSLTHEEEKALPEIIKVWYKGDIDQFLLEIENWNVNAKVLEIAFRKIIKDQIPEEGVRRMSTNDPIMDDRKWLEAIVKAGRTEEDFQERRKLKENYILGSTSTSRQNRNEPAAVVTKKPKYTTKEKRQY